jgi:NAD+ kinase
VRQRRATFISASRLVEPEGSQSAPRPTGIPSSIPWAAFVVSAYSRRLGDHAAGVGDRDAVRDAVLHRPDDAAVDDDVARVERLLGREHAALERHRLGRREPDPHLRCRRLLRVRDAGRVRRLEEVVMVADHRAQVILSGATRARQASLRLGCAPVSSLERVALVVHPTRNIARAVATLERWTGEHGLEMVQLAADGSRRSVAPPGTVGEHDLVVSLGGDGTMLAALRAAAASMTPVLGVACGSLGAMSAMSAVTAAELDPALHRFQAGKWAVRKLPALSVESDAASEWAVNDFVIVRRGPGQIATSVTIDGELYVRAAGDGLIAATPLGSSAYSMAAGGPVLTAGADAFVITPLAMHGGNAPPLVVPADATVTIDVEPGYSGYDVEFDGRPRVQRVAPRYTFTMHPGRLNVVTFAKADRGLAVLRKRGIVTDSPRILARDARAPRRED